MSYRWVSSDSASALASTITSPAGQLAAWDDPTLRAALLSNNPALCPQILELAVPAKGRGLLGAAQLVEISEQGKLPVSSLRYLLEHHRWTSVANSLLETYLPDPSWSDLITPDVLGAALGSAVASSRSWRHLPLQQRQQWALADGPAMLRHLFDTDFCLPYDQAAASLSQLGQWKNPTHLYPQVTSALCLHPQLVDLLENVAALRTPLAGAFTLTPAAQQAVADLDALQAASADWISENKYTYMALAANPVVDRALVGQIHDVLTATIEAGMSHVDVADLARFTGQAKAKEHVPDLSQVDDVQTLSLMLRRALPSEFKQDGRAWELAQLALCPALGAGEGTRMGEAALTLHRYNPRSAHLTVWTRRIVATLHGRFPTWVTQDMVDEVNNTSRYVAPMAEIYPDRALGLSLSGWDAVFVSPVLDDIIGDNSDLWRVVLPLASLMREGTWADLLEVAESQLQMQAPAAPAREVKSPSKVSQSGVETPGR